MIVLAREYVADIPSPGRPEQTPISAGAPKVDSVRPVGEARTGLCFASCELYHGGMSGATIEEVKWRHRRSAIQCLVGADADEAIRQVREEVLARLVSQRGRKNCRFWQGRPTRGAAAAALVIESPGKTGMLFHTPATSPAMEVDLLAKTVHHACRDAIDRGMSLVQALLAEDVRADCEMLERAHMHLLARLMYMGLDVGRGEELTPDISLNWRTYKDYTEVELGQVIGETYEGSLDCPSLAGVREMKSIIIGHKSSGVFRPKSWWLVERDGAPAGCVLVNDVAGTLTSEIIYLGVVPACRRAGLAGAMLRRVAAESRRRGRKKLTLVVDENNHVARQLYESQGYLAKHMRHAYVLTRKSVRNATVGRSC